MSDNIEIVVKDKVDSSISTKIKGIATDALAAEANLLRLQSVLGSLNGNTALAAITASANKATEAMRNASTASTAFSESSLKSDLALSRLTESKNRAALTAQKLAAGELRAKAAMDKVSDSAARKAAALSRTETATSRAASAAVRAEAATIRAATALSKATAAADKHAASMKKVESSTDIASMKMSAFSKLATITGGALSAGGIIKMADSYTVLQNKLANVTTSQTQVNELTKRLFEVSQRTRSDVESTTASFARFDRALNIMGKSQNDTLVMTETINKALKVSGATTTEAAASLLQLSQAFNSNKLAGEEFRSLSENMPVVLDAIAKSLGVPLSQVKKLSSEGKITAEVLFNAFTSIKDSIDATYAKTIPTVAEGLTMVRNSAIQFFGELNKSLGITNAMGVALKFLADNMKLLAVTATVVGAALLVYFGPALLAGIVAATIAMKAFTLAVMANPIGLMLVALTAAISLFAAYGSSMNVGIDKTTKLTDVTGAFAQRAGGVFSEVGSKFSKMWKSNEDTAIGSCLKIEYAVGVSTINLSGSYTEFFKTANTGWAGFLTIGARVVDSVIGMLMGLGVVIANILRDAFNKVKTLGQSEMTSIGDSFKGGQDLWGNRVGAGVAQTLELARLNAAIAENKKINDANSLRKGSTVKNPKLGGGKGGKGSGSTESRADTLFKITNGLERELALTGMLQPLRENQAKLDQIQETLLQKKIKLQPQELENIKAKIKAVQEATLVQSVMDRMYSEANDPLRDYNSALQAADILLKKSAISQQQFTGQIAKAKDAYNASIDPLYEENKALQQQSELLKLLPKQREIEAQMLDLVNTKLKANIVLLPEQLRAYREALIVMQEKNAVASEENTLLESSVGARQKVIEQMQALQNLRANPESGFTKGDSATAVSGMLEGMGIDTAAMQVGMDAQLDMYSNYYKRLDEMRAGQLINDQEHAMARAQLTVKETQVRTQAYHQFFAGVSEMQSSNIKELAMLGKAAAITQAVINTYEGATKALAQGGIYGSVMAAIVVAQGLAQVAAIRSQGFKRGGYTGNMGRDEVAGNVHGQEYVMNANSTSRIGVQDLEALQSGAASVQRNSERAAPAQQGGVGSGSGGQGGGSAAPAPQNNMRIVNVLDPKMIGDFINTQEGEQVFMNFMRNNSSSLQSIISNA